MCRMCLHLRLPLDTSPGIGPEEGQEVEEETVVEFVMVVRGIEVLRGEHEAGGFSEPGVSQEGYLHHRTMPSNDII